MTFSEWHAMTYDYEHILQAVTKLVMIKSHVQATLV